MWKERHPARIGEDGDLECMHCGETYLHQGNATIYEYADKPNWVRVMAQDGGEVTITDFPRRDSANPSSDRNGLILEFWCEHCNMPNDEYGENAGADPFRLAIYQHKGITYMEWVK